MGCQLSQCKVKATLVTFGFLATTFFFFMFMAKYLYLESDFTQYGSDHAMDVIAMFQVIAKTKVSIYTDGQCYTKRKRKCRTLSPRAAETQSFSQFATTVPGEALCISNQLHH